jgi:GWxTD domain-containing protein
VWHDEVVLDGPVLRDTSLANRQYFLQYASKARLANGQYALIVDYQDANRPNAQVYTLVRELQIDAASRDQQHQSDAQFIATATPPRPEDSPTFVRNGLNIVPNPLANNYINADTLTVWVEYYKLPELLNGEPYFVRGNVTAANTGQVVAGHAFATRPRRASDLEPLSLPIAISSLPSSKYILNIELCKNGGEVLLRQSKPFYVANTSLQDQSPDALAMFDVLYGYSEADLDSFFMPMMYLASETEKNICASLTNYTEKRIFFYNFWHKRHNPSAQPGFEFYRFREAVQYANDHFRTNIRPGWASDRGRILLQYGPPNATELFDDPLNYQLWYYNSVRGQSNVYFCFSSRERASGEMMLMHSTVRGETFNTEWAQFLRNAGSARQDNYGNRPVGLDPNPSGGTRFNE